MPEVDVALLQMRFLEKGCPQAAHWLDSLEEKQWEGLVEFIAIIDERFARVLGNKPEFRLGRRDGSLSPLENMALLTERINFLPKRDLVWFERICEALNEIDTAVKAGLCVRRTKWDDDIPPQPFGPLLE